MLPTRRLSIQGSQRVQGKAHGGGAFDDGTTASKKEASAGPSSKNGVVLAIGAMDSSDLITNTKPSFMTRASGLTSTLRRASVIAAGRGVTWRNSIGEAIRNRNTSQGMGLPGQEDALRGGSADVGRTQSFPAATAIAGQRPRMSSLETMHGAGAAVEYLRINQAYPPLQEQHLHKVNEQRDAGSAGWLSPFPLHFALAECLTRATRLL